MKGKKKKGCLIPLVVLVVLGIIIGMQGEKETPVEEPKQQAIIINATDLVASYENNEVKADEMYKGKLLEVTGDIGTIGETLGKKYVSIKSDNNSTLTRVQGMFKEEDIKGLADLNKDDEVTIVGTCEGYSINVILENCKIK